MTRSQFLLPLLCLSMMGIGVALWRYPPLPTLSSSIAREPVHLPKQHLSRVISSTGAAWTEHTAVEKTFQPDDTGHLTKPRLPSDPVNPKTDMTASSWENPFFPENWNAEGWTFSPHGMRTQGTDASSATFLRPYQKLMFECDILAETPPKGSWELRLATKNSQVIMGFRIHDGQMTVIATENGLSQIIVEKPLTVPLSTTAARQIRVVATGNRIVISWDRRRFLATEQLAAQSGREVFWSIHTEGAAYEIPRLRVEGD